MARGDNLEGVREATQFPHNDPTKGGRPISIKADLKNILSKDGVLTIPAKNIVSIEDDGSVKMKLPKSEALAMKLVNWAMSGRGTDSIKAIQMIMEHFDGKPNQPTTIQANSEWKVTYDRKPD